jgi:hypothetical protein
MGLLNVFKFFFERTVTTSTGDLPVKDQKTSEEGAIVGNAPVDPTGATAVSG